MMFRKWPPRLLKSPDGELTGCRPHCLEKGEREGCLPGPPNRSGGSETCCESLWVPGQVDTCHRKGKLSPTSHYFTCRAQQQMFANRNADGEQVTGDQQLNRYQ